MLPRREFLQRAVAAVTTLSAMKARSADSTRKTGVGLVAYSVATRRAQTKSAGDLFEPMRLLAHCESVGAAGMQVELGILADDAAEALRQRAGERAMYIEAMIRMPQTDAERDRFDAEIRTALRVGARTARTVIMPGRRYEQFRDLATFREFAERGERNLQSVRPILERHRFPLAVENHKDHRLDERVAMYRRLNCEFLGACVDTGNNLALLDDPVATVEALAPWAFAVHLKDQAVQPYEEGFRLGDVPLGEGCLNLRAMVAALRAAKPDIRFSLELITREPLKVPCLTEAYWATFPTVSGGDVARTLSHVRAAATDRLGQIAGLSPAEVLALEDAHVARSLHYAATTLKI
jgi:sugar phosphate isomerase/epimerase